MTQIQKKILNLFGVEQKEDKLISLNNASNISQNEEELEGTWK